MMELKPCPFCGGEARIYPLNISDGLRITYEFKHPYYRIVCQKCGCVFGDFSIEAQSAAAWNRRAVETCRNIDDDYDSFFECSLCGCHVLIYFYGSGCGEPEFCPGCGRKVER